ELTVGGTAYYANGKPFAAARGNRLYLRLRRAEEDELRTEAASGGGATPQRDSLGLFPLPASVYDDFERVWTLVVGSFEQTLPPVEEEACGQVLA
ncbi:MAG: hypothetical protein IBX62_05090, partial [Coriobacteriia bacterium]|nr:hypothetical protein [Coriobacteriia bacterium]